MSKTLGNVVDPVDVIETHGTDALRFTLATGAHVPILQMTAKRCIAGYRLTSWVYMVVFTNSLKSALFDKTVTVTPHTRVCSSDSP